MDNKSKTSHFHVFDCGAYMFFPSEVGTNKLIPYSKLIIFIGYEDNRYYFMCHRQENIIFYSTHAIFDERLFPKCTNCQTYEVWSQVSFDFSFNSIFLFFFFFLFFYL